MNNKIVNILDLSGQMTPELQKFLESFNVQFVQEEDSFSHILISSLEGIEEKYNGKKLIALSKPENYQSFYLQGGSFYLNPDWIGTIAGKQILTRYFHSEASSLFSENFPLYQRASSFKITNILSTGEYIDKLALAASDAHAPAFDVRTGFSHLLVYLSCLANESIAGLPFEISFGDCNKDFVLQVHLNADGLNVESIVEAMSEKIDRHSKLHGLFFAFKSCDLLELSYIPKAGKLTISMHWLESVYVDEPGLILNIATNPVETKVDTNFVSESVSDVTVVRGEDFSPEEESITFEGVTEIFKDETILIEDNSTLDDFVMKVKGKFEDLADKSKTVVKGSKIDVDEVVYRIASNIEEVVKESKFVVRPLEKNIVKSLRSELNDYSKTMNIPVEDLSQEEIARFQVQKMPEIIKRELRQPLSQEDIPELVLLKNKVQALSAQIKVLRESKKTTDEIRIKATQPSDSDGINDTILVLRTQNKVSEAEIEIIKANLEKELERRTRRLEIETEKKESLFSRELEKVKHQVYVKDIALTNTKESFSKLLNKKDQEFASLQTKVEQLSAVASLNSTSPMIAQNRELERMNNLLSKQVEIYKNKVTELAANRNHGKVEQEQREQIRQLKMINEKMKSIVNSTKAELDQMKSLSSVPDQIQGTDIRGETNLEFKHLQIQKQQLEAQLTDSTQKITSLEAKLVELSRNQQRAPVDDGTRIRVGQLEASVKKLTQDIIESKNAVNDSKKEINRLRSEKTAIQNQLDKAKKEAERSKIDPAKKGSKAA